MYCYVSFSYSLPSLSLSLSLSCLNILYMLKRIRFNKLQTHKETHNVFKKLTKDIEATIKSVKKHTITNQSVVNIKPTKLVGDRNQTSAQDIVVIVSNSIRVAHVPPQYWLCLFGKHFWIAFWFCWSGCPHLSHDVALQFRICPRGFVQRHLVKLHGRTHRI